MNQIRKITEEEASHYIPIEKDYMGNEAMFYTITSDGDGWDRVKMYTAWSGNDDSKLLSWIYDRMVTLYKENPNTEHMQKLSQLINKILKLENLNRGT